MSEMLYADDLALTSETMEGLREKFRKWKKALESKGLKVNLEKTKVVVSGAEDEIDTLDEDYFYYYYYYELLKQFNQGIRICGRQSLNLEMLIGGVARAVPQFQVERGGHKMCLASCVKVFVL